MNLVEDSAAFLIIARNEVLLFAAVGLILGGLDDLVMDLLYIVRGLWRSATVYRRHPRVTMATLPPPRRPGPLAIFLPAWDEAAVIGDTIGAMRARWGGQDFHLFVGTYPNDPDTIHAVAAHSHADARVHLVIHRLHGPTTKADCLNRLWRAMRREELASGERFKAVILHDAEDRVHADELRLFDVMTERFDMVQLPVRPLLNQQSRWIAGHYADEFAEAHGKFLTLREAIGAAVPSAGVGCAFARDALAHVAQWRDGEPFDPSSLTEDYEIGLLLAEMGRRTVFVRMRDAHGALICTAEHFPDTLPAAVRQKARWFAGIALSGWDRLGWRGRWQERWMRLHDRRAGLAAVILFAAYVGAMIQAMLLVGALFAGQAPPPFAPILASAMTITGWLMAWRLVVRAVFSARAYGWKQGLMAVPRAMVANLIAMLAARRAVMLYARQLLHGRVVWDKTVHRAVEAQGATK